MTDLLRVEGLTTHIFSDTGTVRAVEDVTLRVAPGEAVALVGESGCGKSMTALSLLRLLRPPARILDGRVAFKGRDLLALSEKDMRRVRGGEIAMVFQDPMTFLNPLMRVGEQIAEAVEVHFDTGRAAARDRAREVLELLRIPSPGTVADHYPHQLSGGMRQRVILGMAIACSPDLIVADEPTTALDVTIQAQIMSLLTHVRRELGSALILITHDLGLVAQYCDRVYVMYAGQIVEEADVVGLFDCPQHPYTRALLRSALSARRPVVRFEPIEGQPPSLVQPPSGCRFHPRCVEAEARCRSDSPERFTVGHGRWARCWLHEPRAAAGNT